MIFQTWWPMLFNENQIPVMLVWRSNSEIKFYFINDFLFRKCFFLFLIFFLFYCYVFYHSPNTNWNPRSIQFFPYAIFLHYVCECPKSWSHTHKNWNSKASYLWLTKNRWHCKLSIQWKLLWSLIMLSIISCELSNGQKSQITHSLFAIIYVRIVLAFAFDRFM